MSTPSQLSSMKITNEPVYISQKGVANGVATLDGSGKVPLSQIPSSLIGSVTYQGTWNASTNTPALASGVGTKGYYYVVSVSGSTNLDGITLWEVGDIAIFNGTVWQKIDNADSSKGFAFLFKNSNNVTVSQFLRGLQNLTSNTDPYQILENCILYGVAAQTASLNVGQNWSAEVYVNGVLVPAATLSLNNVQKNRNAISINLNAGDNVSVRCNKIAVPNLLRPQIELFFKGITA